ncbi:NADH:flavin oxidoreductase [Agaribacter marinus]|uniref:NADH:flavin oxidoreductase n=1 Tax=Agaribacter marinus TaxID=1431249 RepID=A0AA37SZL8_9ALTE|nr:NADH:flavin oxidoreductase [Agaribacter marinus]GLR72187.1 NADH:flavin oxidoreductase [Agaribacter marinus]
MLKENVVLESVMLDQLPLKNRVVVAPMTRVSTKGDGIPTKTMEEYYRRYAEGGFGLIIAEGTYTDRSFSQAYPNQPGITNEQQQKGWEHIVHSTHEAGGKIILQLMHAGALSQHLSNTRSASCVQPIRHMLEGYSEKQGSFPLPQAMNLSEIDDVITGFSDSAIRAKEAGFDGVEIHAANGYLLDQFLTDYTNTREDQYGGSLKNRCRLTTEIVSSIKRLAFNNFIVGVRVSQGKVNDFDYTWPNGLLDGKLIFNSLKEAGADYIHFASEGKGFDHGCLTKNGESLPKLAREVTGLKVIANGGLDNVKEATRIIEEGHADLVALGTGALANPDWPIKLKNMKKILPFNPDMFSLGVSIEDQFNWENKNETAGL